MDALLRLSYVRRHVERYAKHVMQLSPLQQPVPLGITIPAEKGYQQQYQQQQGQPPVESSPAAARWVLVGACGSVKVVMAFRKELRLVCESCCSTKVHCSCRVACWVMGLGVASR
jgi:hypothetical protein